MNLDRVGSGRNLPDDFNVIIEIPMNADPIKYEVDKETGAMFVDRFAHFFEHYKDLEPGKWVRVGKWVGPEGAKQDILNGVKRYKKAAKKPMF